MFTRMLMRSVIPTTYQVAKAAATNTSKQFYMSTFHVQTNLVSPVVKLQRNYSEQPPIEQVIVDYDYVKKAINDKNVLIVDVREPDEIKEHGKIPNSVNIPLGSVTAALLQMSEKDFQQTYQRSKPTEDSEIVFYCMIGKRSGMAQTNAMNLGYKNVKNYLGSWSEWAAKTQRTQN